MTTREEISGWFDKGVENGKSFMVVACDSFDYEDYPSYADSSKECIELFERLSNAPMQKVMEVYNLTQDKEEQLNEYRCFRLPKL